MDKGLLRNAEVRRRRLLQLAGMIDGGLDGIAKAAGVSAQNLDHIVKQRRQGTARADGSKPVIVLGDALAKKIEDACGLTPGWFDWPFPHVDFDAYAKLQPDQMAMVQQRMNDAMHEQITKRARQPSLPDVPAPTVAETVGAAMAAAQKKTTTAAARKTSDRAALVLKTVDDPRTAEPSERERELYRRFEKAPKAFK